MSQENSATDESLARQVPLMETARLRIRRLQIEDAPAMLDILSDEETVRYWGRPAMTRLQEAERYTQENLDWMDDGFAADIIYMNNHMEGNHFASFDQEIGIGCRIGIECTDTKGGISIGYDWLDIGCRPILEGDAITVVIKQF